MFVPGKPSVIKHSSLLVLIVSYEENEVLWILTQIFFNIVLSFIDEISSSGPIGGVAGPSLSPLTSQPGNTNRGGSLSTVDLLIKVACFVKTELYFQYKKELIYTS